MMLASSLFHLPGRRIANQRNARHSHIYSKLGAIEKTYPMVTLATLLHLYQKA